MSIWTGSRGTLLQMSRSIPVRKTLWTGTLAVKKPLSVHSYRLSVIGREQWRVTQSNQSITEHQIITQITSPAIQFHFHQDGRRLKIPFLVAITTFLPSLTNLYQNARCCLKWYVVVGVGKNAYKIFIKKECPYPAYKTYRYHTTKAKMLARLPRSKWTSKTQIRSLMNRPVPPFSAGQPLFETRPFMLKPGELTPGITALEYFQRRIDLASRLQSSSIAIVIGTSVQFASGSVFYPFQQNNDLYYLSGWNEPDSVLVIEKPDSNLENVLFHLIVPPKEPHVEQWEGQRTGVQGAIDIFNADESEDTYRVATHLEKLIKRNSNIYVDLNKNTSHAKSLSNTFQSFFNIGTNSKYSTIEGVIEANSTGKTVKRLSHLITDMRAIKSEAELKVMRKAGQISGRAYNQAYAKRFVTERTLHAFLEYRFIAGGCDKSAYIPVVATGANSLCIHYTRNDDAMYNDEMVLVDAAGSLGGYCADISRTWPNSGKFTGPQADLYQAVLNVQKDVIDQCTESAKLSLQDLHDLSVQYFKRELKNVGFGDLSTSDVTKLYPHYIGHNLGLDVHDCPNYARTAKLKAGQVVTVEPGIYVPDDLQYPAHFRNIGIRIEDDIAVGVNDYTNLTIEAAKEIVDIERVAEVGVTTPLEDEVLEVF